MERKKEAILARVDLPSRREMQLLEKSESKIMKNREKEKN